MTRFPLKLLLALAGVACASIASARTAATSDPTCRMAGTDSRWLDGALRAWPIVLQKHFGARPRRLPPIIVYDDRCTYRRASASDSRDDWIAAPHGGRIVLPSGSTRSARPDAFHAQASRGGAFTVMGLPSVWRSTAGGDIPLGYFLEGVLLHELTHSYQGIAMPATTLVPLMGRGPFPADLNTESIDAVFNANPDYVRDRTLEERLLLAAATAPSDAEAQLQACRAGDQLRRRERYFQGKAAFWKRIDDTFLISEGLAQWTIYVWLAGERNIGRSQVFNGILRSTPTHNRAFLLLMTVDRLVPDWRRRLFSPRPPTAEQLLAAACARDDGQGLGRRGSSAGSR